MLKLKSELSLIIVFILLVLFNNKVFSENNDKDSKIEIVTSDDINLGEIVKGQKKVLFEEDHIYKFEIICKKNKDIKILKFHDVQNNDFKIETEWKIGVNTGLENMFYDGIYQTFNNKIFVTVKIKSIEALTNANPVEYKFKPEISVEYVK